jgi:hypothetical protein
MSQEVMQNELPEKTRQLMDGPLKHIRAAALAAALVPLASVLATPASAQVQCASGGICGIVFDDQNNNGVQDAGETGIEGVKVYVCSLCDGTDTLETETGPGGTYSFDALLVPPTSTYTVSTLIPTGTQASPSNVGDNSFDSDGIPNGSGYSVATSVVSDGKATDFGFSPSAKPNPGTGTPGYWKNHSEAWPVASITVGGISYTKEQAIAWLGKVGKDKTTTMFSSLVPAMLNVMIGNESSCVNAAIAAGNKWMTPTPTGYGPVGSNVLASSAAWAIGEPTHQTLDAYNNGLLCAPHRQ